MFFTNETIKSKTILGMLDIALTEMIENDCCTYCLNREEQIPAICNNDDLCKSHLFEGILMLYKRRRKWGNGKVK